MTRRRWRSSREVGADEETGCGGVPGEDRPPDRGADEAQAADAVMLFPAWHAGRSYAAGDRVRYNGVLYQVVQAHVSQADWFPDTVPAL